MSIKKFSDYSVNINESSSSVLDNELLKETLKKIKDMKLPQQQFSTTEQLMWLRTFANALGLYDAADYLKHQEKQ